MRSSSPSPDAVESRYCPHCRRDTPHRVSRERVVAPVLWCLSCFHLHIENELPPAAPREPVAPRLKVA